MTSELNLAAAESRIIEKLWIGNIFSLIWNSAGEWLSWTRQSDAKLCNAEKKILACLKTAYKQYYVDIGSVVGKADRIWTISLNDESRKAPLVLLHGMGSGLALWCSNLDALAATRPLYAIDLLGFGRSSRPKFSKDPMQVEAQWVESLEEWRRELNLGQFILLGHSLGGYIATAYAIKYPERVRHLILADPWGFPEKPDNLYQKYRVPVWMRAIAKSAQLFNPLWLVRLAGPAGEWMMRKARPDLARKYAAYVPDAGNDIPAYLHQCNAQSPQGESAFITLMDHFAWAKNPMGRRVNELHPTLPVTMLYGSNSWVDSSTAQVFSQHRHTSKHTHVKEINGSGHHVYLDQVELFNKFVLEACARADDWEPCAVVEQRAGDISCNVDANTNNTNANNNANNRNADSCVNTKDTNASTAIAS